MTPAWKRDIARIKSLHQEIASRLSVLDHSDDDKTRTALLISVAYELYKITERCRRRWIKERA